MALTCDAGLSVGLVKLGVNVRSRVGCSCWSRLAADLRCTAMVSDVSQGVRFSRPKENFVWRAHLSIPDVMSADSFNLDHE
jgi:hypothetical protein